MSIFPEGTQEFENIIQDSIKQQELPIFKEYAINFETGNFLYDEQGKNIILEKDEALKVWVWKVLQIKKNKYKIYSSSYGNEFEKMIGKGYSKELVDSEIERMLEECLLANPYIKSIENTTIEFEGSKLTINVKIKTVYVEVEVDV